MDLKTDDHFIISDDKSRLDVPLIHRFLSEESYWAAGIPLDVVRRSIEHSLCVGVYTETGAQVAFARTITDYATFAYVGDVFVLPDYRGKNAALRMLHFLLEHPDMQGFRRWMLATWDAHGLYERVGFQPLARPDRWLEIRRADVYKTS